MQAAADPGALSRQLPEFQLTRSTPLIRSHKRSAWLIGEDGRRTGTYIRPAVLAACYLSES